MKKLYKLFIATLFCFLFICISKVNANTIKSIDIDVNIDKNGNGRITEIWNAQLSSGTEGYKPYGNLGKSMIKNFSVVDESGKIYSYQSKWNVNASFENKKYKCGLNKNGSDIELCWGISEYGNKTYTLTYTITNLVNQYNDAQGIYFSFIPREMKQSPNNVKIKIHSNYINFNKNNSQIWSFGYDGNVNFVNNSVVLDSNEGLNSSDYMVALVKINDNIFSTNNKVNKDFQKIYNEAMEGTSNSENTFVTLIVFLSIFVPIILIVCFALKNPQTIYIFEGAKRFSKSEITYYRDIPLKGNIFKAYALLTRFGYVQDKSSVLGAIMLQWLKLGYITIDKTKAGLFSLKDYQYSIHFKEDIRLANPFEERLLKILLDASGTNKILEHKELEKYCYKNYKKIQDWFEDVEKYGMELLEEDGLMEYKEIKVTKLFGLIKRTDKQRIITSEASNVTLQLLGLKQFLLDYSMIKDREAIEVSLWEDYLIYAQLFGIAKKVAKQFGDLYPNYNTMSNIDTDFSYIAISSLSHSSYISMSNGASAGSGGGSFSGGGFSSGGFSSGGGFR